VKGRRELLRRFQVMVRDRTTFAYDSFLELLYAVVREHELISKAMERLVFSEQQLGWRLVLDLPADLLDQGDYALMQTIEFWRKVHPDTTFRLIHDTSRQIEDHRARWEAIIHPDNPVAIVGQDRRLVAFPLPVSGIDLADSRTSPQLQVVDLIAGAACALMKSKALGSDDDYAAALNEVGLLQAVGGGNGPPLLSVRRRLDTDGPRAFRLRRLHRAADGSPWCQGQVDFPHQKARPLRVAAARRTVHPYAHAGELDVRPRDLDSP
jgi:hypothetical protein